MSLLGRMISTVSKYSYSVYLIHAAVFTFMDVFINDCNVTDMVIFVGMFQKMLKIFNI